ncbi:MAG: hypothetical protein FJ317_04325, partial [SAR202 cluster bacterium]|nr:hypothetical protein [SAR202 cluster bacterium]
GLARLALDAIEGNGFTGDVMAYYGHEIYVKAITPWVDAYSGRNEVVVNEVGDLTRIADLGPTRFVAVGDPGEIETLETRLLGAHDSSLHITRSLAHFCEVLHPDGGKDKALAQLCNRLAVKPDEVVAIGNGWNDVHMLRWAGLGIATADAVKEALAAADRIARPVEEDGVAKVLEGLLAQGLFS